jgi:hypothetical protein
MANKLTKAQERKLELQEQEIKNSDKIVDGLLKARDVGVELTDIQQDILDKALKERTIKEETTSLEKKLTNQSRSTNKVKREAGKSAAIQLANLKKSFRESDMLDDSFKSQASIIGQIAAGSATIEEIQSAINDLGDDAAEGMKEYLESQKQSLQIQKFSKDALSETDNIIGGLGSKIKGFLTNPLTLAVAALLTFNATQESIGKQFGAIGVKEFRSELVGANAQFTQLGLGAGEAQQTISDLSNEFGISVGESAKLSENVSRLAVSTGASLTDTTKLIGLFTQTQNLTGEQAANLLASTTALANANNVAPDKILADVAQNTEFFAKFASDGGENILRAAVQARKLGINLQSVEKITSGLLDFQSSLNAENEASVLIGRRLNFQKARELALANDVEGATKAVVEQLGSAEEFNRLNAIQRKALADAAGVEVGELQKIVNKEKEALSLSGALSNQEIKPIPEEVLTQTAQLIGDLQSIGIVIAETLGPPLNFIVGTFGSLIEVIDNIIGIGPALLGLFVAIKGKAMLAAAANIYSAIAGFFNAAAAGSLSTAGFGTPVMVGLATAAVASMIGALSAAPAGDMISPADGKTMVSTKEGGLFEMSKNDDILAGPGLAGGIGGSAINTTDTSKMEQKQDKQNETLNKLLTVMDGAFGDGGRGIAKKLASGVSDGISEA